MRHRIITCCHPRTAATRQLEDERGSRDVTPSTGHRSNRPPVRRVYPTSRHPMGEEATSITRASTLTSTTVTVSVDAGSDPVVPEPAAPSRPSHPHKAEDPWSKLRTSSEEATADQPFLRVGSKVIAKWKDKCWYMATVAAEGKRGRMRVEYADGDVGTITASSLIHIVIAKWKNKCWYMATVTAEGKRGRMRVEYADGDVGTITASSLIHIDSLEVGGAVSAIPLFLKLSQSSSELDLQPSIKTNGVRLRDFRTNLTKPTPLYLHCGDD